MLVTSIFPFSHNVFYSSQHKFQFLSHYYFVIRNLVNKYAFNSLPNGKILDYSKLKACADDKINVTQKLNFVKEWVENIVGKGENAFSPFLSMFSKAFFHRVVKNRGWVGKS